MYFVFNFRLYGTFYFTFTIFFNFILTINYLYKEKKHLNSNNGMSELMELKLLLINYLHSSNWCDK